MLPDVARVEQKREVVDTNADLRPGIERYGEQFRCIEVQEERFMCPACIASTAVMVAGVGSTGGILAVCIGKFRKFFRTSNFNLFQKGKEK